MTEMVSGTPRRLAHRRSGAGLPTRISSTSQSTAVPSTEAGDAPSTARSCPSIPSQPTTSQRLRVSYRDWVANPVTSSQGAKDSESAYATRSCSESAEDVIEPPSALDVVEEEIN